MAKKPPKPYSWAGAAKVNWFPGLKGAAPGSMGQSLLGTFKGGSAPDWFAPLAGRSPFGNSGGGGNPYAGILNDYLNQTRADFGADSAADAAARDAALRRYVISYGQVPDFNALGISDSAKGFWNNAIDQRTKDLALKNEQEGTSIHARMAAENAVANRRIPAALAARGMLRSGQTGSDLRDQAQAYKIKGFDTLNEMLAGVEGTVGGFLQAERERQRALAEAEMQARMNAMGDWGGDMYGDGGMAPSVMDWFRQQQGVNRARGAKIIRRPPPRRGRGGGGPFRSM